jgi:hypothetical protein
MDGWMDCERVVFCTYQIDIQSWSIMRKVDK